MLLNYFKTQRSWNPLHVKLQEYVFAEVLLAEVAVDWQKLIGH